MINPMANHQPQQTLDPQLYPNLEGMQGVSDPHSVIWRVMSSGLKISQ